MAHLYSPLCFRVLFFALVAVFVWLLVVPAHAVGQAGESGERQLIQEKFVEIARLRMNAEYDRAISELVTILERHTGSERIEREAHHEIIWTYSEKGDSLGARERAREALDRYPDIVATDIRIPTYVNELYRKLRREMFGALRITQPRDAVVLLDSVEVGAVPLFLPLIRVGEHSLTVSKNGHHDLVRKVQIDPGVPKEIEVSLQRRRGWRWWTSRVGLGVATVGLVAIGLSSGDDTPGGQDAPLPLPPDPP
jgi:hypothetical protein